MKNKFTMNSLFYKVFHSSEFSNHQEALFPSRAIRTVLQIYPLRVSKLLLGMDTTALVDTLNRLVDKIDKDNRFYISLGKQCGIYPFVIGENRPFVLLIPGGAYAEVCTLNEGFMTALELNRLGYNAFVCRYRVGKEAHFPNPQDDVACCLRWILQNAEDIHVCVDNYAVCGFSAGGHLAASWGTKSVGYAAYHLPKPKTVILGYPVITMGDDTHKFSRSNLLSENQNDPASREQYSIELQVDADYPETFLWACKNDKCVPFQNTQMMYEALKKYACRTELHSYAGDAHGWGLAVGTVAEGWLEQAVAFWQSDM